MKNKIKDLTCNSVILTIGGFTDVSKTYFNSGDEGIINSWCNDKKQTTLNLDDNIKINIVTLIKDYIKNELYLDDLKEDSYTIIDGRLCTNQLVDNDNIKASEREIERWEKGEKTLYIQDISITLKLNGVSVNSELLGELLEMEYEC